MGPKSHEKRPLKLGHSARQKKGIQAEEKVIGKGFPVVRGAQHSKCVLRGKVQINLSSQGARN